MTDNGAARPVAITGIGIISSLGEGVATNWEKLVAGTSGIHRISRFPVDELRTRIAGSVDFLDIERPTPPALSLLMAQRVIRQATEQSGIFDSDRQDAGFPGELFVAAPPIEHDWVSRAEMAHLPHAARDNPYARPDGVNDRNGALFADFINGSLADRLADEFGTRGSPITLSTACASGGTAIQLGVEAIRRGNGPAALAVATDGSIQEEAVIRFSLLSALSTRNDPPEAASRPFSKNRDGFVMAEGAAALVLEDPDHARARGATILGHILGCGEAADTFHRTRSNPDGRAIIRCMAGAIADGGLSPDDVGYVNAHGTSTPENDKMECLGMNEVFGDRVARVPVSSNKSMIGHTLTAAGAIEAVFSLLTLREGMLPPTINHDIPDPALNLDVVPNEARRADVEFTLSNSFGFGGQNVSLLFGPPDA